jgi:hypothetical protein
MDIEKVIGGMEWGDLVVEDYVGRRSRESINMGDLVLEGYEEGPIGGIKWGDLVIGEYERGGQV